MAIANKIKKAADAAADKAKNAQKKAQPKVAYYSRKNNGTAGVAQTVGQKVQQNAKRPRIQGKTGAVKYQNPLIKRMAWKSTVPAEKEVWRKHRSNFVNWVNSLPYDRKDEDKGTTLAQANRLASLWGAVYPTTVGYSRDQARDLQAAAQKAPVDLQNLFIKYGSKLSPMEPTPPDDTSAYFDRQYGKVFGDPSVIAQENRVKEPYRTHWHEYGHNLDWLSGEGPMYSQFYFKNENRLDDTVADDMDNTLRRYWTNVKGDYKPYNADEALRSFLGDMTRTSPSYVRKNAELSDMIGPYSSQHGGSTYPLGYGHSADYWASSSYSKPAEAFADLTSASVTGGPTLRHIQAFLPNTYDQYLEMLAQMARP